MAPLPTELAERSSVVVKVGIVCPYDLGRFGGVQDQVVKLAQWLGEEGDEALVIGPGTSGPPGAALLGKSIVVRANASSAPLRLDPRSGGRIAALTAECDVVHVHEPLMPAVSLGAMRQVRQPLVATFHAAPSGLVRRSYAMSPALVRRVLKRAAVTTAVSPAAAGVVPPGLPVRIVPNAVDVSVYPELERRSNRVVFLGRDDPRKGLRVLLAAWEELERIEPHAELVVMGSEPVRGAPDSVRFLGRVSEEVKRRELARAAILAAPNTTGESFGIILAEGMAAGCAVVASALPGFVHVAGDAAVLVKPGDVGSLGDAVLTLLRDAALRSELQARGRRTVERFDRTHVVAAYRSCFEDALRS